MKENMETVKGFKDFTGEEAEKREAIRKILVDIFEKYAYEPSETPVIEYRQFVKGENVNDGAVSDIFKLIDRGERELALRYEFTFQLKRIMQGKKLPYKRYTIGPVFRDEPTKGNRFRQFVQCDIDTVGSSAKDEAEILAIVKRALIELKIDSIIYINNRKLLNEILTSEKIPSENFEKIIREIDKLDKLDRREVIANLKPLRAEKLLDILDKPASYFKKYENYKLVEELTKLCEYYGVKVEFAPSLARGLSYYSGSVFEVKSKSMKETITAGGSYIFNGVECTGISFGLDRLAGISEIKINLQKVLVLSLGENEKAVEIAETLRDNGCFCFISFERASKALEYANAKSFSKVVFVGSDEIAKNSVKVKDMISGKEKLVDLKSLKDIII